MSRSQHSWEDVLDEREPVADACVRASEEGQQVSPHAGDGGGALRRVLPPLRPRTECDKMLCITVGDERGRGSYLNSAASSPHIRFDVCRARIGIKILCPLSIGISVSTFPCASVRGSERGRTSSRMAMRLVRVMGECRRSVSRTIRSRYGRVLSSSIVGRSVGTARSSSRRRRCISGYLQSAYRHQVVAVLVVSFPATRNVGTSAYTGQLIDARRTGNRTHGLKLPHQ